MTNVHFSSTVRVFNFHAQAQFGLKCIHWQYIIHVCEIGQLWPFTTHSARSNQISHEALYINDFWCYPPDQCYPVSYVLVTFLNFGQFHQSWFIIANVDSMIYFAKKCIFKHFFTQKKCRIIKDCNVLLGFLDESAKKIEPKKQSWT